MGYRLVKDPRPELDGNGVAGADIGIFFDLIGLSAFATRGTAPPLVLLGGMGLVFTAGSFLLKRYHSQIPKRLTFDKGRGLFIIRSQKEREESIGFEEIRGSGVHYFRNSGYIVYLKLADGGIWDIPIRQQKPLGIDLNET